MSTYNNMVSYYNTLPYSQKHSVGYPGGQPWQWPTNYHAPTNHQFITDNNSPPHHHQMYYNPHHMFHPAAAAASAADWHGTSDNFPSNVQNHHLLQQVGGVSGGVSSGANGGVCSGSGGGVGSVNVSAMAAAAASSASGTSVSPSAVTADLSMVAINNVAHHSQLTAGLPSPPITVSGSELSSPGAPASSSSPHNLRHHSINNSSGSINGNVSVNSNNTKCSRNNVNHSGNSSPNNNNNNNNSSINRRSPTKSPYYEWMKKPSYPAQPTPGKTRTKDKYRVVYSDYQRLELEKEYCTSRYITIRRKTELAGTLQLSERQVKIWFQNRRAKERKQTKKNSEQVHVQAQALTVQQVQEHVQAQHLHQHAQHVVQHQMQQQQQHQQHQHHHHHQQQQQQQHQQQQHVVQHPDLSSYMDTKPKIEPGLHHLQHPALHQMSSMAMSMAPMNLHHHLHHGHHPHSLAMAAAAHTSAAAVAAAAVHSHSHTLHHQTHHSQLSPTALAM